jgi:ketosteroid isomerase-like protein
MSLKAAQIGVAGLLLASAGAAFSGNDEVVAPSIEANKAIVRSLFKALNDGDLATRNQLVDPRSVFHSATEDRQGDGDPKKSLREACPMCASLTPREITIDFMMAEGDLVTVRSTWRGKYTDVMRDVPISGHDVVVHYTNTYRLANGRIVENWAAYDRLHLLEQLGFVVSPPTPASPAK